VKCFYETFVLKQTVVHLLNFGAENPPLRQYPNRYWQVKQNKNQHGLREPKGLPPNVTKRKIKKVETRTH